jgi:hypothetical protein
MHNIVIVQENGLQGKGRQGEMWFKVLLIHLKIAPV